MSAAHAKMWIEVIFIAAVVAAGIGVFAAASVGIVRSESAARACAAKAGVWSSSRGGVCLKAEAVLQ